MAFEQPTVAEINDLLISQLEANLNQTIPLLPRSFNRVLVKALSGLLSLALKYGGFIFLQIFVSKATNDEVNIGGKLFRPLTEWGRLIGVGDIVPAEQAEYIIDIPVVNQTGSLPSGTGFINSATGVTYLTIGSVALNSPIVQATIRASADQSGGDGAGDIGNMDIGTIVSAVNPLANIARDSTVSFEVVRGADGETVEQYRQRIVDRWQKRPEGGAPADYESWGEEVVGIINTYPYTGVPGEVNVYSEATPESSGSPDGIPTAAQLQAVQDSIQFNVDGLADRRPINALVNSLAITRLSFDVFVQGISVPGDLGQVQQDIIASIDTFFFNREPFIAGLTIGNRKDLITRSALIGLVEDIVTAADGIFTTVEFELSGSGVPIEIFPLGEGEKAKGVTFFT